MVQSAENGGMWGPQASGDNYSVAYAANEAIFLYFQFPFLEMPKQALI